MDEIEIVEYNPNWANMFEHEAESIRKALGKDLIAEIQHLLQKRWRERGENLAHKKA